MEIAMNIPILVFVIQVGKALFVINLFACKFELHISKYMKDFTYVLIY